MCRPVLVLAVLLASATASAQPEVFFGSGGTPVYKEQELDKRFLKSGIHRGLTRGTRDAHCAHVLAGLLTLLAETAPYLHKRDENFYLDPMLVNALQTQLINPRFPGNAYLASMVRRVWIEQKLPSEWLAVARALNQKGAAIDIAKLQQLADGLKPIESFYFSFPALKQRYEIEVRRANTAARSTAVLAFRDAYLDRNVAWTGMTLLDIGPPATKKGKGKTDDEADHLVARLEWHEPDPYAHQLNIYGKPAKKPKPTVFEARLSPNQYVDIHRIPKETRVMVRGRFWGMNDDLTKIELRDAVLFGERDFSQGVVLADPNAVALCPLAVNDLAGTAPRQPGGFGIRP